MTENSSKAFHAKRLLVHFLFLFQKRVKKSLIWLVDKMKNVLGATASGLPHHEIGRMTTRDKTVLLMSKRFGNVSLPAA